MPVAALHSLVVCLCIADMNARLPSLTSPIFILNMFTNIIFVFIAFFAHTHRIFDWYKLVSEHILTT